MTSVWVVVGRTGEYSDVHEWAFGYYATEVKAKVVAEALEYAFRVFLGGSEGPLPIPEPDEEWLGHYLSSGRVGNKVLEKTEKAMKSIDPDFSLDYTGTCYEVREIRPGPSPGLIKHRATAATSEEAGN